MIPFQAHIELLHHFLADRDAIVQRIEGMLNAQRKPAEYLQNRALLLRHLEDLFFMRSEVAHSQLQLRDQLEEAHWASGFRPRDLPGLYNGLLDSAEMMVRGFHLWQQTRWPGRNGRARYAATLFNLYVIRRLELLSMRLWDAGSDSAAERLSQLQRVLDRLWTLASADQPVLVRDARWLIQLAQSPATDELGAYFEVATKVAESLTEEDRLAVHKAGVCMAAGHLRSQARYHSTKRGVSLDDRSVVLNTRNTNALDFALLVHDLVPLLEAYERAWRNGDEPNRMSLAEVILQGLSADPELFVNRTDLLGAYSTIEHLFATTDHDGHPAYTSIGRRHRQLFGEYQTWIGRLAQPLLDDSERFRPIAGSYSPYGILYGFSSNLIEHMVLRTLQPDAVAHFGLEDVFAGGDDGKLAWVNGWRKLPHLTRDVAAQFDYPQRFAEDIFDRMARALRKRVADDGADAAPRTGRLFILTGDRPAPDAETPDDIPARYVGASDVQLVAEGLAEHLDEPALLSDRREGRCLVSYQTSKGWVAISKAVLTEVLGAGRDIKIAGLPTTAAGVLQLMGAELVVLPERTART
jgi:hypothetical protein